MIRDELKSKISDHLVDMIIALEETFDVEFDHDDEEWHEIENKLTDHVLGDYRVFIRLIVVITLGDE